MKTGVISCYVFMVFMNQVFELLLSFRCVALLYYCNITLQMQIKKATDSIPSLLLAKNNRLLFHKLCSLNAFICNQLHVVNALAEAGNIYVYCGDACANRFCMYYFAGCI